MGVVVATPAVPTPGEVVQQWMWDAVVGATKPLKFTWTRIVSRTVGRHWKKAAMRLPPHHRQKRALHCFRVKVLNYRALVTDINLKGRMTGWDVARKARELHPEFPIVYMTGGAAEDWGSQGVPNSILLVKPFAPAQLVTAVSQLLNSGSPTTPSS
jgi:DNA-binding response OmpR family regulator